MMKVEAVVVRDRVETVMEAVEEGTGPRRRDRDRGRRARPREGHHARVPRAGVRVALPAEGAHDLRRPRRARRGASIAAIVDAARTGHVNGDGICWASPVFNVTHNRTGLKLEEVEKV